MQVVLPATPKTDFREISGTFVEHLPDEILLRADYLVDAGLTSLVRAAFATLPGFHDESRWTVFEAASRYRAG